MSGIAKIAKSASSLTLCDLDIDTLLAAQIIVAWAGEKGDTDEPSGRRLEWWRTELIGEGAEYDLKELLPNTWHWAMLQSARYAAVLHDTSVRQKDHDPDRLLTLYSLGFEIDEKVDERLVQFKQNSEKLEEVLPDVATLVNSEWSEGKFLEWVKKHGKESTTSLPAGRRLKGKPPEALSETIKRLIAGLAPLADTYPMPHFRRG